MNDMFKTGEFVRLSKDYSWGGGKHAGQVVEITEVQDERETLDRDDALIYTAQLHARGMVVATGIVVQPSDIDETYDHYEAQRAAFWNQAVAVVTS